MAFLHGVETIVKTDGPIPINIVKSAVIGVVGIAPTEYGQNEAVVVSGTKDAASFGKEVPGFNIPKALAAIFAQGAGQVIVVNVFDATDHTTTVTRESKTPTAGKLSLGYAPIGTVTIENNDNSASTLVLNEDYTIDAYGNFVALTANVVNGTALKFTYKKLNAAAVTSSVIIGEYDEEAGTRTGMQVWDNAKNTLGYNPKILIAPGYSSASGVQTELISKADKFRAVALIDVAYGTTVSSAITERGVGGDYTSASKRAVYCYPFVKAYDKATDANEDRPFSQFLAGVIASRDLSDGYWWSPSNKEVKGIVGLERSLSAAINDSTSDVNQLNEVGITTVFNAFGTGFRSWGNRSAAYPANTTPDQFINVQRTCDVIHESLEQAALQFIDRPINQGLIDSIRESGNAFIRTLIQRGALLPGSKLVYDTNNNSAEDLAAGHLTFDLVMMVPVPGERLTFNSFLDISLLSSLA
jgi:uncharacterized protein